MIEVGGVYMKKLLVDRHRWELALICITAGLLGLSLVLFLWKFSVTIYQIGIAFSQPQLLLSLALAGSQIFGFFIGLYLVLIYFDSPFSSWSVLRAKSRTIITISYIPQAILLLPSLIYYWIYMQPSLWLLIPSIAIFLVAPLLPLVLAMIVVHSLHHVVSRIPKLYIHQGALALILVLVLMQASVQLWVPYNNPEHFISIFSGGIGEIFLYFDLHVSPILFSLHALLSVLLVSLLLFCKPSIVWVLAKVELRMLLRNPVYAVHGLMGYVSVPIILFAVYWTEKHSVAYPLLTPWFQGLTVNMEIVFSALYAWFMVALSTNAATTFSRTGSSICYLSSLPFTSLQLLSSRFFASLTINTIGTGIGLIVIAIMFQMNWYSVVSGIFFGVLLVSGLILLLILLDFFRPYLDWTNPSAAIKQNLNVFYSTAISMGLGALFVLRISYRMSSQMQQWILVDLGLFGIMLLLGALMLAVRFSDDLWRLLMVSTEKGEA